MPDRPHVVLLTVLPKERRARHPYQLCMMLALITLSVSQLIIGPAPNTAITALTRAQQDQLNWYALIGGAVRRCPGGLSRLSAHEQRGRILVLAAVAHRR